MADFNFDGDIFAQFRVQPMQSLCGILANNRRPTSIELTAKDLDVLLAERPEKLVVWLVKVREAMAHG